MRRHALFSPPGALALAGAIAILALGPVPGRARAAWVEPIPADAAPQRLRIFDFVWSEIRDKYYDPAFNGVDWQEVRALYRSRVAAAGDDGAFHDLLRAMVGELRDAHTRVLSARQARDRRENQSLSAGVILFEVEGQPVVFAVRPASPAAEAGLRPGLRVLAVDGIPVDQALARTRADVGPSSSERAALVLSYLRLIAGPAEEPLRLRLEGAGRAVVVNDGLGDLAVNEAGAAFDRRIQQHLVELGAPHLPSGLRVNVPIFVAAGDREVPFDPACAEHGGFGLDGEFSAIHFVFETEQADEVAALAGGGFADVKAREFVFLDDHAIDAVRSEKQGAGAAGRPTPDNGYRCLHLTLLELTISLILGLAAVVCTKKGHPQRDAMLIWRRN